MKRRARTVAATLAPVRRLVMLAVLVAFAFQAYVVQTHIHSQPQLAATTQASQGAAPAKPLPSDPLDPATCKLCQELVHSGAAITPAGAELTLLMGWAVSILAPAPSAPRVQGPRTGWQSRAPPKA